jgi:acyl-CoA thioester hydrolase|tara:strand:- start:149 stop:577 length:429 start_codon:yes stop_codon:yes gene_type:complete
MNKKQDRTLETEVNIKVPFHDVDAMAVVWHGNYAKYFEIARCALLDKIDYNYNQMRASNYAWPIIDMRIRYINPVRFGQLIQVNVKLVEYEYRLKLSYLITDAESGQRLTRGSTVQVAVDTKSQEMCFISPDILREKLGELV